MKNVFFFSITISRDFYDLKQRNSGKSQKRNNSRSENQSRFWSMESPVNIDDKLFKRRNADGICAIIINLRFHDITSSPAIPENLT